MHSAGESCYSGAACQDNSGYRLDYASHGGSGLNFSAGAGYRLKKMRFEVTASQHAGGMNNGFHSPGYYDANGMRDRSTTVYIGTTGDLRTLTMAFGIYRDVTAGAATSYLGAGVGLSQTVADGIYYEPGSSCVAEPTCAADRSVARSSHTFFHVRGWGISRHLYGGVDYDFGAPFLLGVKLAYNFFADLQEAGRDDPAPGMRSAAMSVGGINRLSFSVGIKYGLGK